MKLRRDVFQAIADPTRRAIITLVAINAMTPTTIAGNFDSSRQTISKHIQILTECEILLQEQKGREIYYQLNPNGMKEIADFIEPFRKFWDDRFNKLESVMKNYQSNSLIFFFKSCLKSLIDHTDGLGAPGKSDPQTKARPTVSEHAGDTETGSSPPAPGPPTRMPSVPRSFGEP